MYGGLSMTIHNVCELCSFYHRDILIFRQRSQKKPQVRVQFPTQLGEKYSLASKQEFQNPTRLTELMLITFWDSVVLQNFQ